MKPRITEFEIKKMVLLRKSGLSIYETQKKVPRSTSSIYEYVKNVKLRNESKILLDSKRFPSKKKSKEEWAYAQNLTNKCIKSLSDRDLILITAMLYWGEGNKKAELNLINGDGFLIKVFVQGLLIMGVPKDRLRISLRLYDDINEDKAVNYWVHLLKIKKEQLVSIDRVEGKKNGKLVYGMCRVRIEKGSLYFKRLMSMIEFVKGRHSSMDRTRDS